MQNVAEILREASKDLFNVDIEPEITRTEERFGDYATNIALQLGGKLNKNPREIAVALASKLHGQKNIKEVNIAGPGFINIILQDGAIAALAESATELHTANSGREILIEFGDPNPFKEMHIGHLYSYIVGDSISRLLEASGAQVRRLSYHGDVGLHVAKTIWSMLQKNNSADSFASEDIGVYYAKGSKAYEEDPHAKDEIHRLNEQIYKQEDTRINKIYNEGKEKSFKSFDSVLAKIGIDNDKRYLESESSVEGIKLVKDHIGKVFEESQGAIIYDGEKVGLHTRVFITSKGLPTYEAKDLGLAELKNNDYPNAAQSVVITANEQSEYFNVMLAALSEIDKELAGKTTHLSHGFVNLSSGKMSSRTGDVYSALSLIKSVEIEVTKKYPNSPSNIDIGAIKYGFLKHRLGSNITYDVKESVSLEGNSGPYLQYAHARAQSILQKVDAIQPNSEDINFDQAERSLARKISEYSEVVEKAAAELMPHYIATYLYELAQTFNSFYEKSRVIGDNRQSIRLKLVQKYVQVLRNGLSLLGITAPDKM